MPVRTIYDLRMALGIEAYEYHNLRDSDSAKPDMTGQFGLLGDDYAPKPAFETYRRLIAELSVV